MCSGECIHSILIIDKIIVSRLRHMPISVSAYASVAKIVTDDEISILGNLGYKGGLPPTSSQQLRIWDDLATQVNGGGS